MEKFDRVLGALMLLWVAVIIVVMCVSLADAQEVTSGATIRSGGFTGGEHYEYTWYTDDEDWRFGLSYTTRQTLENKALVCGTFIDGPICYRRDLDVEAYPSAYVQRIFRKRKVYAALGVAMHEVREPLLSMTGSFRITAGYQFDRQWSLEWTHMSNARLRKPNYGQDLLLVRYRWAR